MTGPREVWQLPHRHIGYQVWHFDEVASTNDVASAVEEPGLAVLADRQSSGRGQYGRVWVAPPRSSVLLSVRLEPPHTLRRPVLLTAWAAVSVCETIAELTGLVPRIKWPNDVLIAGRKVCGVLIEQGRAVIAGVGLNVNQGVADFEAAGLPLAGSLASVSGRTFDTTAVARLLLTWMDRQYDRLTFGEFASLESTWQERLGLLGREVVAECFDGTRIYGRLTECALSGIQIERGTGVVAAVTPEQIRALSFDPKRALTDE